MTRQLTCKLFFTSTILLAGGFVVGNLNADCIDDELLMAEAMNDAQLSRWCAELEMGRDRLAKVEGLYEKGHASWLESAKLRVRVQQLEARCDAEFAMKRFLRELRQTPWQAPLGQRHAYRFRAPGSLRLVGWFDVQQLPEELTDQLLRQHSEELVGSKRFDSTLRRYRKQLDDAVTRLQRLKADGHQDDSETLHHATLELNLAQSNWKLGLAQHTRACRERDRLARLERIKSSGGNYRTQETSAKLLAATLAIRDYERRCRGALKVAKIQCLQDTEHLAAVKALYQSGHASRVELDDAQQALAASQAILSDRQQEFERPLETEAAQPQNVTIDAKRYWQTLRQHKITHPTVVLHLAELRHDRLITAAAQRELQAELEFQASLLKRIRRANARRADSQSEQRDAELDIALTNARLLDAAERLNLIKLEESRFVEHLLPIVQNSRTDVDSRVGLAMSIAGVSLPSPLLLGGALYLDGFATKGIAYFESSSVIDPVSVCRECTSCESPSERLDAWRSLLRRSTSPALTRYALRPLANYRASRSIMLSDYDQQRLCSYYRDLPGSYCPVSSPFSERLNSSYAVPARLYSNHPNWLGIRTTNIAQGSSRWSEPYPGVAGFAGISVERPVMRRVPQRILYRPSLRVR